MCDSPGEVVRVRDVLALIFSYQEGKRHSEWMVRFMNTVYQQLPDDIRDSFVALIDRFPKPWTGLPKCYRGEWDRRIRFVNAFVE